VAAPERSSKFKFTKQGVRRTAPSKDVSEESSELRNAGRGALDWRSAGRPARDVWDRTNRRNDNLLRRAADPGARAALAAPSAEAGKARSSPNASRHGFNVSIWNDAALAPQAEEIVVRIAGPHAEAEMLARARAIAKAQTRLDRVRT